MFPALNLLQYVGEHTYITLSNGKLVFDQKKVAADYLKNILNSQATLSKKCVKSSSYFIRLLCLTFIKTNSSSLQKAKYLLEKEGSYF